MTKRLKLHHPDFAYASWCNWREAVDAHLYMHPWRTRDDECGIEQKTVKLKNKSFREINIHKTFISVSDTLHW